MRQRPFRIPALGEDLDEPPRRPSDPKQRAFRAAHYFDVVTSLVENAARLMAPPGSFMGCRPPAPGRPSCRRRG